MEKSETAGRSSGGVVLQVQVGAFDAKNRHGTVGVYSAHRRYLKYIS